MKRLSVLSFVLGIALNAAADCPFNIPEVSLQPHQVAGFSWVLPIKPGGDACVDKIEVENGNQNFWYVGGFNGVWVTHTNGVSWFKALNGHVGALLWEPVHQFAYAGVGNTLWFSRDHGLHWVPVQTFAKPIMSLFAFSPSNTLYIGLAWDNHVDPTGVFTTNLGGGALAFLPFGGTHTGLIVWTISRDPMSGALYAGTEIFDHLPQPYKPPFFRRLLNAQNWDNVANNLPWHVIDSDVRPNGYVYALTEGSGLWGSSTMGNVWIAPSATTPSLGNSLLMDPFVTTRLYAGRVNAGTQTGGLWRSINSGNTFSPIGLTGVTVGDIALNGNATRIYAAAYASGIYTSPVP